MRTRDALARNGGDRVAIWVLLSLTVVGVLVAAFWRGGRSNWPWDFRTMTYVTGRGYGKRHQ